MICYCYRTNKGEIVNRYFPMGKAPKFIDMGLGNLAHRDFRAEQCGVPSKGAGWPIECIASGVNAGQADQLRAEFERVGVPTEVSKNGNPIYTDATHRRKALKARGLHDRKAFY
jgi:hypothetical protein